MKRLLLGLAASAAMISVASGAFASAQFDNAQNSYKGPSGPMTLAQAAGGTSGNAGSNSGPAATEPAEQVGGKRKTEAEMPAPKVNPDVTDKTGASDAVDPSQSKRKSTTEPAQSGSK